MDMNFCQISLCSLALRPLEYINDRFSRGRQLSVRKIALYALKTRNFDSQRSSIDVRSERLNLSME